MTGRYEPRNCLHEALATNMIILCFDGLAKSWRHPRVHVKDTANNQRRTYDGEFKILDAYSIAKLL